MAHATFTRCLAAAAVTAGVALGAPAAPALAATVQLADVELPPDCRHQPIGGCPPEIATALVYEAAPGEANVIGVIATPQQVRLSDRGAVIEVGAGCATAGRHRVRCRALSGDIDRIFIDAGDRADTVLSGGVVDGGPGRDRLVGSSSGDQLYGGRGADVVRGRGGSDQLYEASPQEPFGRSDLAPYFPDPFGYRWAPSAVPLADPGAGRDAYYGGRGYDTLSYEGRVDGIRVDLATSAPIGGARGERDSARGFVTALGGAGHDRLAGDDRRDELNGLDGDDHIVGRRGADLIEGGGGRNVILAGPGNDDVNQSYQAQDLGADRILCGPGTDRASSIYPSDFVNDDCEGLDLDFIGGRGAFSGVLVSHLPLDKDSPGVVLSTEDILCIGDHNPSGCGITLEVRVEGPATEGGSAPPSGTLLGSQSYTLAKNERRSVTLELSPRGAEILRLHRALIARVNVIEDEPRQTGGYLTVLRAP